MAKIGILTSTPSFSDNYGAILQGYALQYALKRMGHKGADIVYRGSSEKPTDAKKASPLQRFRGIFLTDETWSHKIGVITSKKGRAIRAEYFQAFAQNHLAIDHPEGVDYEGLKMLVSQYDAFICGSDQVWNPRAHGGVNDPGYFLQFSAGAKRTISYAPSFGVEEIPPACQENIAEFVANIDYVSVREDSGAAILKRYAGLEAPVVVDPTLLLAAKEWDELARRPEWLPEKYIACYKFGERSEYDEIIKKTAAKMGAEVVNIPAAIDPIFKTRYDVGPSEFLSIIKNADLVCADSFHATVFSLLYSRPCVIFPRDRPGSTKSMNSRMVGLLNRLGIEGAYADDPSAWEKALNFEIDYEDVFKRLAPWKTMSLDYLSESLKGI